jgi:formylglycine-generating enzyme
MAMNDTTQEGATAGMKWLPGGSFLMGSDKFYPEEGPVQEVTVGEFWIDTYAVTNRDFTKFVDATGYVTVAERPLNPADYPGALPHMLVPGALVFKQTQGPVDLRDWSQWWEYIPGACWNHPEGTASSIESRMDHPVVHVAFEDAEAYAKWTGKRLPTEAEWEYAARGGLVGASFCWGEEMEPNGKPAANTWQGDFPYRNLVKDGYERTAPVGMFPPNGYGLYDMAGNVWEWTSDWFVAHREPKTSPCCSVAADRERSYDPAFEDIRIPRKVLKGGSYLCAPNYCLRFRPAARSPQMIDTGMSHLGFRCVKDGAAKA